MNQLLIVGLVACCLLSVAVIAYLVRALNEARRAATEKELTPDAPAAALLASAGTTRNDDAGMKDAGDAPATDVTTGANAVEAANANTISTEHDASGVQTSQREQTLPVASGESSNVREARDESSPIQATSGHVGDSFLPPGGNSDSSGGGDSNASGQPATAPTADIYAIADAEDFDFNRTSYPSEVLQHEAFRRGVEKLRREQTEDALIFFAEGANVVVACMALEALAERTGTANPRVAKFLLDKINDFYYWARFFALRALHATTPAPAIGDVLARLNGTWMDGVPLRSLREFVALRLAAGETPAFERQRLERLSEDDAANLRNLLDALKDDLPASLADEFELWMGERVDIEYLKTFGRVWQTDDPAFAEIVTLAPVVERVCDLEMPLRKEPPRSVLLVGESGVGKTSLVRVLGAKLQKEGWTIFEASAADVLAGQTYMGQLEGRVQTFVRQISGKKVLWVVPNFHELMWAGRHQYSPTGVLDLVLPRIESGEIKVVGETQTVAYERMMQMRPKLRTALETCRVAPLSDAATLELARAWAAQRGDNNHDGGNAGGGNDNGSNLQPRISEHALREAFQLAKQYLGDKAAPGNLLAFLDSTHRRLLTERGARGDGAGGGEITLDDLLVTLSQLTGLPVSILDERAGLNLQDLRAFFEQRVLGQPEAIECLVERVAMIKAGLTDPTRPEGVFLFVGPTGTGKTEIAKTLAEFLFGSPERMIRLDMSEFQTPDSLDRILGEQSETAESIALVNAIRKQPFSVVLLDEFEKANPNVWDLFLQVFDDGRLTDRRGNTADFRYCVVIMTSNLGATLPAGAGIGFSQEQAQFAPASVERAVTKSFRREFLNRIDRVVVFRPLGLNVMRELLRKELNDVLQRRGLRNRAWAVEWDESAVEFLLHKGFTADLGARPLKRAIERYLLSPLALTIVNHQFPEGDQFLFVRSSDGERIEVEFIDPDAPEQPTTADAEALELLEREHDDEELRLEGIALDARGTAEEVAYLRERFTELDAEVGTDEWQRRKASALEQTTAPGFWDSPERFAVLGLAEYMDRIETGLETGSSLLGRLRGSESRDRKHFPPDLVARLALQLYLLDAACRALAANQPRDAFLQVRASRDADATHGDAFAARIGEMYRQWAEKRRMRFEVLEEHRGDDAQPYTLLASVSGFGAYAILEPESGLHVLETPQDEKSFNRAKAQVRVVAQPDEPAGHGARALRTQAENVLAQINNPAQTIVRRYREDPSPLVRDSVRQWRTGRLDRVLGGDFDLMF